MATQVETVNGNSSASNTIKAEDVPVKRLHDEWILWYHDPNDTNWELKSYKIIAHIHSINDFWNTYEFLTNKVIENSMLFLMRSGIQPMWEDPKNINGGCWSFKITKGIMKQYWTELSIFLLGENIMSDFKNINGLSISPKKSFCIIKIWNCDKTINNKELINKKMEIPFDSCIYKQHK